jgi:hypothetical protein
VTSRWRNLSWPSSKPKWQTLACARNRKRHLLPEEQARFRWNRSRRSRPPNWPTCEHGPLSRGVPGGGARLASRVVGRQEIDKSVIAITLTKPPWDPFGLLSSGHHCDSGRVGDARQIRDVGRAYFPGRGSALMKSAQRQYKPTNVPTPAAIGIVQRMRPDDRSGSKCEILAVRKCFPLYPISGLFSR